ncbi:MAG: M48 family metallopeptidase [Spirochaetales bacterium]|nr:M48 family metallopeptidase [Spirochaetales bacterium]
MDQVIIKRRRGQKNIRIRITRTREVIVSAPFETPVAEIRHTLLKKSAWIHGHLQKLNEDYARFDPVKTLMYNGRHYRVVPVDGTITTVNPVRGKPEKDSVKKGCPVCVHDSEIQVCFNPAQANPEEEMLTLVRKWLISRAKATITPRVESLSRQHRIKVSRIMFRNQKTRWGSSSSNGTLSFNWRIIMAPPAVQDYLIIHELIHQRHMNHSKAYWKDVAARVPDYEKAERWLKDHRNLIGLFR